jgi:bifunctional UDP-N-acetylglucosamine pyrophosphorylase/glucosamine-1-phosphate N-acetyltransferase
LRIVNNEDMASSTLSAIVLAAGGGTRMRSTLPKPLHRLCGRPMLCHVLDALAELQVDRVVVVVGYRSAEVVKVLEEEAPANLSLEFVEQSEPRGTGDATAVGLTGFPVGADLEEGDVVVLPGDAPLLRPATLAHLVAEHRSSGAAATLLSAVLEQPTGYGRVVRGKDGGVARIVEQLDASYEERQITEVATSVYCFKHSLLAPALRRLAPSNVKGEIYLTDAISVLESAGYPVIAVEVADPVEAAGVNDRAQLAAATGVVRDRLNERWMRRGVTMIDPEATYLDHGVELAEEVTLAPGVVLEGRTRVERGTTIGPGCHLVDTEVGEQAWLDTTHAVGASIGAGAVVGPYAYLTRGCQLAPGSVTGAFFSDVGNPSGPIEGRP